jgi:acid stress-induced BolA-like protein IbaG/YrbA
MSGHHPTSFQGDIVSAVRESILAAFPEAEVHVAGGGGHFQIEVVSPRFAGQGTLQKQRPVYAAIAHLMKGNDAPVHAVDSLVCRAP